MFIYNTDLNPTLNIITRFFYNKTKNSQIKNLLVDRDMDLEIYF